MPDDAATQILAELEAEAVTKAGASDFGSDHYRPVLLAWIADLLAPELNEIGRVFSRRLAFNALVRRLRVFACLREHPEISRVQLPAIVLISGVPRTGTTLAHNLLALHERTRALLRWELMDPVPPPEAASYATDPRIAKTQRSIDPLRGSLLEHMHWVNAAEPEECVWGYLDGTNLMGRSSGAAMPRWRQHVIAMDPRPTFREYRALLQLLLWHNPLPQDGVLVLKCPQISGELSSFAEVFPGARYVLTHRDPYRALLSSTTMLQAINAPFLNAPTPMRRGQDEWLARHQARALAHLVDFSATHADRIVHLRYPELLDDEVGASERVLLALGLPHDPGFRARAEAFLARQRAGERAAPPAAYDDFGYDHDALLAEPQVARYCRYFALVPERVRRTGT